MNEQKMKLESAKNSVSSVKTVLGVVEKITWVGLSLCIVGAILVLIFQAPINERIAASENMVFRVDAPTEFVIGIVKVEAELQTLVDQGEYALTMTIVMGMASIMLLIMGIIFNRLLAAVKAIEKSETPFSGDVLLYFKRVFVLVSVMIGILAELSVLITVIFVFVCLYKVIAYGVTLQEEIDETL